MTIISHLIVHAHFIPRISFFVSNTIFDTNKFAFEFQALKRHLIVSSSPTQTHSGAQECEFHLLLLRAVNSYTESCSYVCAYSVLIIFTFHAFLS